MGSKRLTRVNELLKREIAESLYRIVNEGSVDLSVVTVTHVVTSPDLRHARVLISIRTPDKERSHILSQIKSHRKAIQHLINKHTSLKYTPHLQFELDGSIEEGNKVLDILSHLEKEPSDLSSSRENPE